MPNYDVIIAGGGSAASVTAWRLVRDAVDWGRDAARKGMDVEAVRAWLLTRPGVTEVHDLHIWAMSTTEVALTAHLTRPSNDDGDAFLHATCDGLASKFSIGHATLQIEVGEAGPCRLAHAHAI